MIPVVSPGVSSLSSVVCFEVQGASAQEGMLIKLKPLISLSI